MPCFELDFLHCDACWELFSFSCQVKPVLCSALEVSRSLVEVCELTWSHKGALSTVVHNVLNSTLLV